MSAKKGGWGSVFSGAIANLESRLDTILADEPEAAAAAAARGERPAAAEQSKAPLPRADSTRLAAPSSNASAAGSREASRTRVNDRLADRLAKATAAKPLSRTSTPANAASPRASGESKREEEAPRSVPEIEVEKPAAAEQEPAEADEPTAHGDGTPQSTTGEAAPLSASTLPVNPARISIDGSRSSAEITSGDVSARPSIDVPNGAHTPANGAADLTQDDYKKAEAQRQEDMHVYLERIDALQAKLTYLAKETVAAAKEANASAGTSLEKQLAEKDEKIALLMEEGEKLSKSEMQRMQTIKKLRAKTTEDDKTASELRRRLDRAERAEADLKAKLRKAEVVERQANEKTRQIAVIEKTVDELKVDRENASELIRNLTTQLKEAKDNAARAEKEAATKATEAQKSTIADLQNELEDVQIEKKLAEDRAAAEIKKFKEEADRQREKFSVRELELKNEIHGLESRLEALRARLEETNSSSGGGEGESTVKLMRQVETLQQQYALAKSNWETIEGSLNARVAALEKERDEAVKRESEIRKKARDVGAKSRKAEEELESTQDRVKSLEQELQSQQELLQSLQSKLDRADSSQSDLQADFERQRKMWETELISRIEEEKLKWRREMMGSSSQLERLQSPTTSSRKSAAIDLSGLRGHGKPLARLTSYDLSALHIDAQRSSSASGRSSMMPTAASASTRALATPTDPSPSISRRESTLSFKPENVPPPTPSIEVEMRRLSEDAGSSPQRTIADLVSTSTAGPGAGPSVQLVDRLSGLVRKLESEKASFKDELYRLSQQRDEARNEVVDLMREAETKRGSEGQVEELEKEMAQLKGRYDASLEMLGEREEEVEELKDQIGELKRIYKELVETKVGGNAS